MQWRCWWALPASMKFDIFTRRSIQRQMATVVVITLLVFSSLWGIWLFCAALKLDRVSLHGDELYVDLYDMFVYAVNPPLGEDLELNVFKWCVFFLYIIGAILITGVLITILVNWIDRRKERWLKGDAHYKIRNNFDVVIGGHKMVANLCRQLLARPEASFYIVIQTKRIAESLRNEIESVIDEKDRNRIVIYSGDRTSSQDLQYLNVARAKSVYIIGENKLLDQNDHDTQNLQCLNLINGIMSESQREDKMPCHVMFEYQSSFHVFQYTDFENAKIDFIPFNFYKVWAQQVFVKNKVKGIEYVPLDGRGGIRADSPKHVHLIVIGMSKMGTAMAVEAAHLCHFPNFVKGVKNPDGGNVEHPRTLITFIDRNAEREMNFFKGRYRNMFQMARWRFAKAEGASLSVNYDVESLYSPRIVTGKENPANALWHDPMNDMKSTSPYRTEHLGENFIDIDWEFIEGDMASPSIQKYLSDAAKDDMAVTTIAICLPVTAEAISAAMYMPENVFRSDNVLQVLVQQSTNESIIKAIADKPVGDDLFTKLRPFGMWTDCDYIGMSSSRVAAVIAYIYRQKDLSYGNGEKPDEKLERILCQDASCDLSPAVDIWNAMSASKGKSVIAQRISNICYANSIGAKQRSFGMQAGGMLEDKSLVGLIAEVEHNRWNMEQLLIGYRAVTEDEEKAISLLDNEGYDEYKKELKRKRVHLDLRAYGRLNAGVHEYDTYLSERIPCVLKIMEIEQACDK